MQYDRAEYQRIKLRRLEQEVEGLRAQRDKLLRMLALACQVAGVKAGVDPVDLCRAIEDQIREEGHELQALR